MSTAETYFTMSIVPPATPGGHANAVITLVPTACSHVVQGGPQMQVFSDRVVLQMTVSDNCTGNPGGTVSRLLPIFPTGIYPVELQACNYGNPSDPSQELPVEPCTTVEVDYLKVAPAASPVPITGGGLFAMAAVLVAACAIRLWRT